ncbi:MAG: hypothetical protein Ct9H90mP7_5200 [Candidatus Neomarinimicrobiota bacterium]|nr:MAG: hypothetical protein Ct9H90mP7_5200 [Candidatus Neomarinimicrobiota bacterium]
MKLSHASINSVMQAVAASSVTLLRAFNAEPLILVYRLQGTRIHSKVAKFHFDKSINSSSSLDLPLFIKLQ